MLVSCPRNSGWALQGERYIVLLDHALHSCERQSIRIRMRPLGVVPISPKTLLSLALWVIPYVQHATRGVSKLGNQW